MSSSSPQEMGTSGRTCFYLWHQPHAHCWPGGEGHRPAAVVGGVRSWDEDTWRPPRIGTKLHHAPLPLLPHEVIIPSTKGLINSCCVSGSFSVLMYTTLSPWLRLHEFELWDEACHSYTHGFGNAHQAHAQVMFELPVPTPFHRPSEKVVNNPGELLRSPNL